MDPTQPSTVTHQRTRRAWQIAAIALVGAALAAWHLFSRMLPEFGTYQAPADRPVHDAPYITTPADVVESIVDLAEIGPNDLVYDLGCGDGRLVIAACRRHGCRGIGLEKDPARLIEARANAEAAGVGHLIRFIEADILKYDFSDGDAVLLYLLPKLNEALVPQFLRLKAGARIVSSEFEIKGLPPESVDRFQSSANQERYSLYLYRMGPVVPMP